MDSQKRWVKKMAGITPLLVIGSLVLAACGGAAATPVPATPTTAPVAEATATTPAAAEATPTEAMAAATPTEAMAEATATTPAGAEMPEVVAPEGAADITFWHGYTGVEAETMGQALQALTEKNPDFKVTVLAVPFDQLKNKVSTEAATGGGPDLFLGPPDWAGELAAANLIADLGAIEGLSDVTAELVPTSLDMGKYQGMQYGIPSNLKNVALYYNTDLVKTVPANTEEMITMAGELATGDVTYGVALNTQFYHMIGYNFAYGGKLFTDEKTVDLTTQGTIDWLTFMQSAAGKPGVFAKGGADQDIDNLFKTGKAAMVFNGPWALGDYTAALGEDKVKVVPAPDTPNGGKFAPFVGGDVYYVNASSTKQAEAVKLIDFITSAAVQQAFVDAAGHVSTNTQVDLSKNPNIQGFVEQSKTGTPFPNIPAMGQVWTPAGNMITAVMDGQAEPAAAAKQATDEINAAIAASGAR
ncbi:MAG TPA: extracellular solute-binding protein [Chloroflexia bacterium]|nr:extracellular solute-binding protein [Chloroflexia bacterium]